MDGYFKGWAGWGGISCYSVAVVIDAYIRGKAISPNLILNKVNFSANEH